MLSPNIYTIQLVLEWIICLLLTGLIWTVQLVHYPSFQFIEKDSFVEFEKFHQRKISILVIPLMILEVLLSFYNLFNSKLPLSLISPNESSDNSLESDLLYIN